MSEAPSPAMLTGARLGLSSAEAAARRAGDSRGLRTPLGLRLRKYLRSSLIERLLLLLLVVAAVYAVLGAFMDAAIIFGVVTTVAGLESWLEWRAGRAISGLSRLSAPRALVWRDGKLHQLWSQDLVRDDVILLSAGGRVPADARLVEADDLLVDESLVTGESQPVEYRAGEARGVELAAGSRIVRGRATAIVTAVGESSTLGRVSTLVRETEAQKTPLQRQMAELTGRLLVFAVVISLAVPLIGIIVGGQPAREMLLTGLTLAFATVPAELPILVVVVLGIGSLALAKRGAIVRRLSATETLGATTLICTDKTGTLTENRITLTTVVTASQVLEGMDATTDELEQVRQLARLASEAPSQSQPGDTSGLGAAEDARLADPVDLAVWRASRPIWPDAIVSFAFDSARRMASGLTEINGRLVLGVKGAPEAVMVRAAHWRSADGPLPLDSELKDQVIAAAAHLSVGGARVLAVASRTLTELDGGPSRLERELVFEGLLAFSDPLRPEVPQAVRELMQAGVAITMVTGDQPATAAAVARSAGLGGPTFIATQTKAWSDAELAARAAQGCVVARARPEDKLRIVQAAATYGQVVAVTGDGINDAPALEAAAVGVAMGRSGSDVAREAADLVLTDDSFATLARATTEGRRLNENLRKAVRYYLAVKLALITVSLGVAALGRPLPFVPVQIALLELFMDLGAAVAFVHQAREVGETRRRPRDHRRRFLDGQMLLGVLAGGVTLAGLVGGAYLLGLPGLGEDGARTLALVCWLVGHAALGVVMGWERRAIAPREVLANPAMVLWASASVAMAVTVLAVQPVAAALHAGPVPPGVGILALVCSLVLPFWLEAVKRLRMR